MDRRACTMWMHLHSPHGTAHMCTVQCNWLGLCMKYACEIGSERKQINVQLKPDNRAVISQNGNRWNRFELNICLRRFSNCEWRHRATECEWSFCRIFYAALPRAVCLVGSALHTRVSVYLINRTELMRENKIASVERPINQIFHFSLIPRSQFFLNSLILSDAYVEAWRDWKVELTLTSVWQIRMNTNAPDQLTVTIHFITVNQLNKMKKK